jgi:hypothetical protein
MDRRKTMLARLGNVLYWTGCIAAALWFALGIHSISLPVAMIDIIALVSPTLAFWLIGRALRYVLSGT